MIDVTLLDAMIPEEQVAAMCERARRYGVASVTVRPSDVQLASKWLGEMTCGTFLSGDHTTAVKNYECRDLLGRGAKIVTAQINLGKLVSRQFQYIEMEYLQLLQECKDRGARLIGVLEMDRLSPDLRVIACKIMKRAEVHAARWSMKTAASDEDLAFFRARLGSSTEVDAGGDVQSLEEAKRLYRAGVQRFSSASPWLMLEAWKSELAAKAKAAAAAAKVTAGPPS